MYKYIYIQYIYTSTTVSLYPVSLIISVPEYQVPSKSKSILSYIEYYLNTPLGILMYYKRDWKLHCPKCIGLKVS